MKKGLSKAVSFCMMLGLLAQSVYIPAMAEEATTEIAAESDTDTSLVGTLAFAQCEEYINIRESASTDSAVTAKITTMAPRPSRSRTETGIRSVPVMRKGM